MVATGPVPRPGALVQCRRAPAASVLCNAPPPPRASHPAGDHRHQGPQRPRERVACTRTGARGRPVPAPRRTTMSHPIDDAEQLIANAEEEFPPPLRSLLIAKLRKGEHIDDAAEDLGMTPQQVFSAARILASFGDQLDATLTAERDPDLPHGTVTGRSEERRVGKEARSGSPS